MSGGGAYSPVLRLPPEGLPERAVVVGDPARAARAGELLDGAKEVARHREYLTLTGDWRGSPVSVTSHGVGAPGALVAFEELMDAGVRTLVRVGTAGSMRADLGAGAVVVAEAAVRDDGVTDQYLPAAYPATCCPELVLALCERLEVRGLRPARGIVWTRALLRPAFVSLPIKAYADAGVIAIEMELSALLVVASARGGRAAGVFVLDGPSADAAAYRPDADRVASTAGLVLEAALDALVGHPLPDSRARSGDAIAM